jgi:hypothetical protein
MSPRARKASAVSQTMLKAGARAARLDWDATVRDAFLNECVKQGVRAELAIDALRDTSDETTGAALRTVMTDATRRAALGWLTIENCLEQFGELAALALERCVEEAAVATESQRGLGPSSEMRPRTSQLVLRHRDEAAAAIVRRGRDRLARFWEQNGFFAA